VSAWTDYLEHQIKGPVLRSGESFYPSVHAALEAMDWLEQHRYVVLGFDGLDTDGWSVRARLDRIADFSTDLPESWPARVERTIAASRQTLAEWIDVQFVDLVVDEPPDR